MFGRKKKKWFLTILEAKTPIKVDQIDSRSPPVEIVQFILEKIRMGELQGYFSSVAQAYIPKTFIINWIRDNLSEGVIDIVQIIDLVELPSSIILPLIKQEVKTVEGFFDIINRKFFTIEGAMTELNNLLRKKPYFDLSELLELLLWKEDDIEKVIEMLADRGKFRGYIDPLKKRLYNFTFINVDPYLEKYDKLDLQRILRFINLNFQLYSEAKIELLSKLMNWNQESTITFFEEIKKKKLLNFIFSKNYDSIIPTELIIQWILEDVIIYKKIPLSFWVKRFSISEKDFRRLMKTFIANLGGKIDNDIFEGFNPEEWLKKGISVEDVAAALNLNNIELLELVKNFCVKLKLKFVAGDTYEPFTVKGIQEHEIFCQVDMSKYINPDLFFECQNCHRIICSNCRSSSSSKTCPFCGNISDFIVDLPRYCEHCQLTYVHSYNLPDVEECYFCKRGPLKSGWPEIKIKKEPINETTYRLIDFIKNNERSEIPLKDIFEALDLPQSEVISLLEKSILNDYIEGHINIVSTSFVKVKSDNEFICKMDGQSHNDKERYVCQECQIVICKECFSNLTSVGMLMCPECESFNSLKKTIV